MPDAPAGDASSEAAPEASPDVVEETSSPEAAPDAPADSPPDSSGFSCGIPGIACCCDGDVSSQPICGADGAVACTAGMTLYFGADCARTCGPCMLPCPDSGVPDSGGTD